MLFFPLGLESLSDFITTIVSVLGTEIIKGVLGKYQN